MDVEAQEEKRKYDLLWTKVAGYRDLSPGEDLAPLFLALIKNEVEKGERVIDFGSGSGRAAKEFIAQEMHVDLVDISPFCLDPEIELLCKIDKRVRFHEACLWDLPANLKKAPWIFCCDVMEHIPMGKIDCVLQTMASHMQKKGFFSICMKEEQCRGQLDFALHLAVQPMQWWKEKLEKHFHVDWDMGLENGDYGIFLVKKKDG